MSSLSIKASVQKFDIKVAHIGKWEIRLLALKWKQLQAKCFVT